MAADLEQCERAEEMRGEDPRPPRVLTVQIRLCWACLTGVGGECHTSGCALFLNRAPDLRIHPELYEVIAP